MSKEIFNNKGKRKTPHRQVLASKARPSHGHVSREQSSATSLPKSASIWSAYAKVNYDTIPASQNTKVWELVGGNIGATFGPPDENSCATRLSYALNFGGAEIPNSAQKPFGASKNFTTESYLGKKGDGKNYIVSAANMQSYLTKVWGPPSQKVNDVQELQTLTAGLATSQCAIFATKGSSGFGHTGMLKGGYHDPFVEGELPVDVWILPVSLSMKTNESSEFAGTSKKGDFAEALHMAIDSARSALPTELVKWRLVSVGGQNGGIASEDTLTVVIMALAP